MQYYTRLFHDTRVPYGILDEEFTVYEEAETCSGGGCGSGVVGRRIIGHERLSERVRKSFLVEIN
jgi:hypothetical protein